MPCLVGCLAVLSPRLALILVWWFGGGYIGRAYEHWLWPLLGFVFFPLTTLAFAFAFHSLGEPGEVPPFGWLLVALAVAADLGLIGGGGRTAWRRRRKESET
jgi:hypothetical protein